MHEKQIAPLIAIIFYTVTTVKISGLVWSVIKANR